MEGGRGSGSIWLPPVFIPNGSSFIHGGVISRSFWFFVCLFLIPKCVYWNGFPLILILGAFHAASFCRSILYKPGLSSCRRTEHSGATSTQNSHWGKAKDGGDVTTSWAFHTREVGIGTLPQVLLLVFLLLFWNRVEGDAFQETCSHKEIMTAGKWELMVCSIPHFRGYLGNHISSLRHVVSFTSINEGQVDAVVG